MGAVSVTAVKRRQDTSVKRVDATVTFSASYATGGDTIKLGDVRLNRITDAMVASTKGTATHGVQVVLAGTDTAPKLKLLAGAVGSGAEVANATDTHLVVVKMRFLGY